MLIGRRPSALLGVLLPLAGVVLTAPLTPSRAAAVDEDPRIRQASELERLLQGRLKEDATARRWEVAVSVKTLPGKFGIYVRGKADDGEAVVRFLKREADQTGLMAVVFQAELNAAVAAAPAKRTALVQLHYLRDAVAFAVLVNAIVNPADPAAPKKVHVSAVGGDALLLSGESNAVGEAQRLIAQIDLPRAGVNLEMIGVQLSSNSPDALARQMDGLRREIAATRRSIAAFFGKLKGAARCIPIDPEASAVLKLLGYEDFFESEAPSLVGVLVRLVCAHRPADVQGAFEKVRIWLATANEESGLTRAQLTALTASLGEPGPEGKPLARFLTHFGLKWRGSAIVGDDDEALKRHLRVGKKRLLSFAAEYANLRADSNRFVPTDLQAAVDALDPSLQAAVKDLSLDVQDLLVAPAINHQREVIRKAGGVEFAQVGRTSVATLNGTQAVVAAKAVSAFDYRPPLTLSQFLDNAKKISDGTAPFIPKVPVKGTEGLQEAVVTGGIPVSQLIGLIGAFGEQTTLFQELSSGVSISITPNILRNAESAELEMDLKVTDPTAAGTKEGVPPPSRISQHEVKSRAYVKSLDLFEVSTFANQATVSGGRAYVPLLGPVWQGLFSDVPFVGNLFSWKRRPKTKYHFSVLLVTTAISPTAMGVAALFPLRADGTPRLGFGAEGKITMKFEEIQKRIREIQ